MNDESAARLLAGTSVSPELRQALTTSRPDVEVAVGQLWRARLDETSMVILTLSAVDDGSVDVAAVTVAQCPPPDSVVPTVDLNSQVLRRALAWPAVRDHLPLRTFEKMLEASEQLEIAAMMLATNLGQEVDALDPGLMLQAELQDELANIARAPGLPVGGDEVVALKDKLPGDGASKLQLLCSVLDVPQHEAMSLLRGSQELAPEAAATVEAAFGLAPGELAPAVGFPAAVVAELDQPRHKSAIVSLAQRRKCTELEVRRAAAQQEQRLAARATVGAGLSERVAYVLEQMQ